MPRKPNTPAQIRATADQHVAAARRALKTLSAPLDNTSVCYCPDGNADGITEAECGCQYMEAAKILEAAGCYVRRHVDTITDQHVN